MAKYYTNVISKLLLYKDDLYGGIIAGIIALPLALAFGVQSGLGPVAGLSGAIILGFTTAIIGGMPTQISGPTAPMTVVASLIVLTAIKDYGSINNGSGLIVTTFFLAGFFQIIFGLFRIGSYIKYIPQPVISGFMSGIGIIIILFQIYPLLGYSSPISTIAILNNILEPATHINYSALSLGIITIACIYLFRPWDKYIPSIIIAFIISILLSYIFHLNVETIGKLPEGLHLLKLTTLFSFDKADFVFVMLSALTLAGLGSVDTLLTSVMVNRIKQTPLHSNRELIGQGIGNSLASLAGGIPGSGATMRTMANVKAGANSRLSGVVHSLLLLLILLGMGKYVSNIPRVVLSAILINVGFEIIDFKSLKILFYLPRTDMVIMLSVMMLTIFTNLLEAIAAGMILSAFFFMKKLNDISIEKSKLGELTEFLNESNTADINDQIDLIKGSVYVKSINGPLFWGLSRKFYDILSFNKKIRHIVLYLGNLAYVDQSALTALEDAFHLFRKLGINVYMVNIPKQANELFIKTKFIPNLLPEKHIYKTYEDLVIDILKKQK